MNMRYFALYFWIVVILALLYIYFFAPEVFYKIFYYGGAGSPYVNTPRGQ